MLPGMDYNLTDRVLAIGPSVLPSNDSAYGCSFNELRPCADYGYDLNQALWGTLFTFQHLRALRWGAPMFLCVSPQPDDFKLASFKKA
jgi:hypothetical protein